MTPRRTIAFLAVNASYSHSSLAAWCLRSVTDLEAWDWHTLEVTTRESPQEVAARLAALAPHVVGATLYLFTRRFVLDVLEALRRQCPQVRHVVGGPECLGDNQALVANESVDVAIRGEGERAWPALLQAIAWPDQWPTIPGVCTARGGAYRDGGWAEVLGDLDERPSFYPLMLAGWRKPFVQLETSRGCANGCLFCTSRETHVRTRSLDRVRADLEVIVSRGVRQVRVVDRTFNDDARRSLDLIRLFRDDFRDLQFHLEMDPARVSERLADELAAGGAGRFHLEAGVQSLSEAVIGAVGRKATARRTWEGLQRLCRRRELAVHVDLIAGLPGGTLAGLREDLGRLIGLRPLAIQLERLKLLPGTPLATTPEQWGLAADPEPPYAVHHTPDMTEADMDTADRLARFLDWFYNIEALRDLVGEALGADPLLMDAIAGPSFGVLDAPVSPTLEARFKALHQLLVSRGNATARAVEWQWIRRGFSLRHGLCPAQLWTKALPPGAELVEGDAAHKTSRRWRVELDRPHIVCYGAGADGVRRVVAIYRA